MRSETSPSAYPTLPEARRTGGASVARVQEMRADEKTALQRDFWVAVVLGGNQYRPGGALPCWYGEHIEDPSKCEGRIIASHVIKRRRVENFLGVWGPHDVDLVIQAAWDPRNAVAGCKAHDDRLDGHQMPPLVIPREKLPPDVIEFAEDWGLEYEIERRFSAAR